MYFSTFETEMSDIRFVEMGPRFMLEPERSISLDNFLQFGIVIVIIFYVFFSFWNRPVRHMFCGEIV